MENGARTARSMLYIQHIMLFCQENVMDCRDDENDEVLTEANVMYKQ